MNTCTISSAFRVFVPLKLQMMLVRSVVNNRQKDVENANPTRSGKRANET